MEIDEKKVGFCADRTIFPCPVLGNGWGWGYPPSPTPSESLDWRGFRKDAAQNLERQGLEVEIFKTNGLGPLCRDFVSTCFASSIFCFINYRVKVRCHNGRWKSRVFVKGYCLKELCCCSETWFRAANPRGSPRSIFPSTTEIIFRRSASTRFHPDLH